MQIDEKALKEIAEFVVQTTIKALEDKKLLVSGKTEKTAYQKTEQLLYNYLGFKKIVRERLQEIEDLRKYGVPQKCGAVGERVQNGNLPQGIVLPEESVESAVCRIERSVQDTVQAINLIDKCMAALKNDPYYEILPMRYFEGRTQEDVAVYFKCDQGTISRNKGRLIRELAMRLFPDQSVNEMMQ